MRTYWQTDNWKSEVAELGLRFPQLTIIPDAEQGGMLIAGTLPVASEVAYSVSLALTAEYPRVSPILRCDPREVEPIPDRHVNSISGEACLCVRSELRMHWPLGSTITQFIDGLVLPYLDGQFYYDTHGYWPIGRQRTHGVPGIIEAYRDLCARLGNDSPETIERLMRLLARKNHPKGHELCPCRSGLRLRDCHIDVVIQLRERVDPVHALRDLHECFPATVH